MVLNGSKHLHILWPFTVQCSDNDDDILTVVFSSSAFVPAALQSVFPQTELGSFMVLLKRDKEQQLRELTMIVTGIRLFNKANDKREEKTDLYNLSTVHQPADSRSRLFNVIKSALRTGVFFLDVVKQSVKSAIVPYLLKRAP